MTAQRLFHRLRLRRPWFSALLVCCGLGFTGCGATKPPTDTLSKAELAVEQADDSQAGDYAALELQTAREQLDEARQAMQDSDYDKARREAEKALVNAQLAEAKAETASARETVEELRQSIESLRQEALQRSTH